MNDENMQEFGWLVGKTIVKVERNHEVFWDDRDSIELTFSDGQTASVLGTYGAYTGKSKDEYVQYAYITLNEER